MSHIEAKAGIDPVSLVSIVVTLTSAVKCITFGTTVVQVGVTLKRASKRSQNLSYSLQANQMDDESKTDIKTVPIISKDKTATNQPDPTNPH